MKKVAGRLKLELAQFRALEAFAQFASELDAATLAQINRGQRLVQTLNQNQYDPWPVEEQVAIIWATTNGHVDGVDVADVSRFNDGFRQSLRAEKTILTAIRESLDLSDDTVAKLKTAAEQFASGFQGSVVTTGATA
jgi:F-type H+-transporting ATPase subunit alpha